MSSNPRHRWTLRSCSTSTAPASSRCSMPVVAVVAVVPPRPCRWLALRFLDDGHPTAPVPGDHPRRGPLRAAGAAHPLRGSRCQGGVVLGFAAALVALSPDRTGAFATAGRAFAVLSGLVALASFWPRRFWLTDLRTLREKYLTAEAPFTRLNILDATVAESMQVRFVLIQKARLLKASMVSLAVAVLFIATASPTLGITDGGRAAYPAGVR